MASVGEWAGKMRLDIEDAVAWLIQRRVAPVDRIAIGGGSYGGYAALVGTLTEPVGI